MGHLNSAVTLCWNELEIAKDTVRLLLKEDHEVILVDNGSTDGSKEYFSQISDPKFKFIDLPKNMGASVGRNKGIDACTGKNIFLIDGDILYIKGTIDEYQKVLDAYPDAGCVGQNSQKLLNELGHNGVLDPSQADYRMSNDYEIEDWFPMAWTQYGLFRGDMLRKLKFPTVKEFGKAGYGYEDDWLYHDMKRLGWSSLSVDKPVYYHHAHSGWRELNKAGLSDCMQERKKLFEGKWGKGSSWVDTLQKGKIEITTRDNPNNIR